MGDGIERGGPATGFGEVSRRVGRVFHAGLLASTWVGLVALVILLALVAWDAIQPQTADSRWYLTYVVTLVVPTVVAGWAVRQRTSHGLLVGAIGLGLPILGLLFGAGLAMLFIDVVSPVVWLGYVVALGLPTLGILVIERWRGVPWTAKIIAVTAGYAVSLAVVPGAVASLAILPADWLILVATLAVPTAAIVGRYADQRWPDGDAYRNAALGVLLATAAAGAVGLSVGVGATAAVLLTLSVVVPVGLYAVIVARDAPADRLGMILPAIIVVGLLAGLLTVDLLGFDGPASWVDWQFLTSNHNNDPTEAGVYPAMVGSVMLMLIVALVSFPLGIGAAVYLEEYAPNTGLARVIDVNISNLAGVPSVVYGLLGLGLFITYLGTAPGTVLVGGLTLALLILPIVIISAREAIRSVPDGLRDASYGMGATRWQTIRDVVLPEAFPGILTGTILALGRAIGETAPLLVIGAAQVADLPTGLDSRVVAMPLQIFVWATTFASPGFYRKALPAGVIVLLVIMLAMNAAAIVFRNRVESTNS